MVRSSAEQLIQERLGQRASAVLKGHYVVAKYCHPLFLLLDCSDIDFYLACGIR